MIQLFEHIPAARCLVLLCMLAALTAATALGAEPPVASPAVSTRCGWFDNPSPGNADLIDGTWSVAQQGGHQAEGAWPSFAAKHWIRTGVGSYGYSCICLTGRFDAGSQTVVAIARSRPRPPSACRADKALRGLEPENPLK